MHSTTYDNSTQNPANPDPNRVVPWGEQSLDEMLYGVVQLSRDDAACSETHGDWSSLTAVDDSRLAHQAR